MEIETITELIQCFYTGEGVGWQLTQIRKVRMAPLRGLLLVPEAFVTVETSRREEHNSTPYSETNKREEEGVRKWKPRDPMNHLTQRGLADSQFWGTSHSNGAVCLL